MAEEHEEKAEEAEEQAEEAAPQGAALALAVLPGSGHHAHLIAGLQHSIRFIQSKVRHIRQDLRIVRLLPHTTTRWLVHLPKKRAQIRAYHLKIRELRQREAEAAAG